MITVRKTSENRQSVEKSIKNLKNVSVGALEDDIDKIKSSFEDNDSIIYNSYNNKTIDDKKLAKKIQQAIRENDGYCICKFIKNEDTKCQCKEFREQESGICHCGLFIKEA